MFDYITQIFSNGNEILLLSLLIIMALLLSRAVAKLHLPKITGYIIAGIIIGKPVLNLISPENFKSFHNINLIALGLMSITMGAHLNLYKLKNSGRRVISVLLLESSLSFIFVFISLRFFAEKEFLMSLLIASISIATAPAATVATVKETRSKGLVVNTLMPVVAINNVLCIVTFGIIVNVIDLNNAGMMNYWDLLVRVGKELLISIIIGTIGGFFLKYFAEKNISSKGQVLSLVLLTVLMVTGLSEILSINLMLPCMVIGILISNTSQYRSTILTIFDEFEYFILIIFFALAGAHIDIHSLGVAGVAAVIYFLARALGKTSGGFIGAYLIRAPKRVYKYIGITLLPQAGVAIGLVILAGEIEALSPIIDFLSTLILAVVALNEIIGPPITKWALYRSGDAEQDRRKLIEFLQEDYITTNLKSKNKEDAINEMISFFIKSHNESKKLEQELKDSVFQREAEGSTGIGDGVAIPHGVTSEGPIIWGALGLSREGIDFDSIDEKPVHLIILIVTPKNHKADLHLAVLSEISKLLSDASVLKKVIASTTAAEICDILIDKEQTNFNYFLD
ncbi:MAG: PTS transporter subunit EIIA [bacterium]|nr:PTS transporter subunit EIIA [bacterium]